MLVACATATHKHPVPELFDMELRALRRERAARQGPELFLLDRAFDDCLDRLALMNLRFDRMLLIGCPDAQWPARLSDFGGQVDVIDPSPAFASAVDGDRADEDAWQPPVNSYDLVLAVGTLDTVNDLPRAMLAIRMALRPGSLFLGAMSGGETLPRLRAAMRAADAVTGEARPHVHPRIEASALAPLLAAVGFTNAVVDVDRVPVSYRDLHALVRDLRAMAATNILKQRSHLPLSRPAYAAAEAEFGSGADGVRITETFEILHFACWSPSA